MKGWIEQEIDVRTWNNGMLTYFSGQTTKDRWVCQDDKKKKKTKQKILTVNFNIKFKMKIKSKDIFHKNVLDHITFWNM